MSRQFAWLLVVVAIAFLAAADMGVRASERAHMAITEAHADSLFVVALDREHAVTETIRAEKAKTKAAYAARDSALARAEKASRASRVVVERIIEVAGDSAAVVEAVAELESVHAEEVSNLHAALFQSDSVIASQGRVIGALTISNDALHAALGASRAESRAWEIAAKPKLFGIQVSPETAFVGGIAVTVAALLVLR